MPPKRRKGKRSKRRRGRKKSGAPQKGEGPVWDAIKKGFSSINEFAKKNKLISRGAAALAPFAGSDAPTVSRIGAAAGALGYGKGQSGGLQTYPTGAISTANGGIMDKYGSFLYVPSA